jgi:hypothetical protein
MKNRVVAFLVTGFLVCAALVSYTYGTGRSTVQPASFEFVVDWDASEVSFERHHGTDWLTLKWRESGDGGCSFWIDESGVAARASDLKGHRFRIHVKATSEKMELESLGGTGWKKLSCTPLAGGERRAVVNEYGIRSEVVVR